MNIKRNVLIASVVYIAYVVILLLVSGTCHDNWCRIQEDGPLGLILFSFAPLLPLLFFSLITYHMKDEVFQAWWSFAQWWVLVIIAVTFLLENASGGGTLGMNKDFAVLILGLLYTILIVTSLVKIVRAYMKTTREKKE